MWSYPNWWWCLFSREQNDARWLCLQQQPNLPNNNISDGHIIYILFALSLLARTLLMQLLLNVLDVWPVAATVGQNTHCLSAILESPGMAEEY